MVICIMAFLTSKFVPEHLFHKFPFKEAEISRVTET